MISPNIADLEVAARVLSRAPSDQRQNTARVLLRYAAIANEYRRCNDRPHPLYGTGTLMSAAMHYRHQNLIDNSHHDLVGCLNVLTTELLSAECNHMT